MFDSKSENRDRAVEAVESVSEAIRVRVRVRTICELGLELGLREDKEKSGSGGGSVGMPAMPYKQTSTRPPGKTGASRAGGVLNREAQ